jgi:N-acetylmuramoyl-L-alanine amidase
MKNKLFYFILLIAVILTSYSFNIITNNTEKPFIVVLDAGHGGHDPGNLGNGYKEKDIALSVILKIGKILEKQPDFKIIYTRKTDVFLKLEERASIANKADADVFVSVHCNSFHTQAYGAETYVMGLNKSTQNMNIAKKENEVIFLEENYEENYEGFDPNSPESLIGMTVMQEEYLDQSIMLAALIQNNIVNNLKRKDRSVKQDVFWVLHNTYMPSALVELGFLTNNKEGPYINSEKGRKEMAREIANGIITYNNSLSLATNDAQDPAITQEEIDKAIETVDENIFESYTFKVQLAASSKKLSLESYNFKGLIDVSRKKEGKLFKYYYGETSDYNKIQLMKKFAEEKGHDACYIVVFKDDKKLKLSDVLNSINK